MRLRVVLHADDFGFNRAVNEGIVRGFQRGLLTSTALLANAPHAAQAIVAWKQLAIQNAENGLPRSAWRKALGDPIVPFDLGVHLNLTQGRPLTGRYPAELLDEQGCFPGIFRLFSRLASRWRDFTAGIRAELVAQITFLLDHGLRPTHLNGHQYVELIPPVACLVRELLPRFHIHAVRAAVEPGLFSTTLWHDRQPGAWLLARVKQHFARRFRSDLASVAVTFPSAYFGTSHAGRIDGRLIELFLRRAPAAELIEIALHPAVPPEVVSCPGDQSGWLDPLAARRPSELLLLESDALSSLFQARNLKLGRLAQLRATATTTLRLSTQGLTRLPRRRLLQT